ncbi:Nitrogen fixation protein FixH [Ectothiorhodosinus mongolicus]|uniref:Nitrogen fixation protein FixH n=1 Tax=Ectothiorhodosinus mongolicus TaxID=233100 RepID=A0A1R3VUT8_9GAMM|nr:FixH family protein [Ectothiorhodosinus mongolicus]ULX56853.1 nitrogen fixation protein FixH [Ectothiorhodosinus mongolicus]SIT68655.1 Nitrogen fixation protein FixH [Ectothiorhodosinus mongolicus]
MDSLVLSLSSGVAAAALLFFVLYRFTQLRAYQVSVTVLVAVMLVYIPISIVFWQGADVFAIHFALYFITPYGLGMIMSQLESQKARGEKPGFRIRFHWAPATIIGFFMVIATVNGILLTVAHQGMPSNLVGRILPEPRSGGQEVTSFFPGFAAHISTRNQALAVTYLEQAQIQAERGWQVRQGWIEVPRRDEPAVFQVEVVDRYGDPVRGAYVSGEFMRPSDERRDQEFQMREVGPGVYQVELTLTMPGRWDLLLQVVRGSELHEMRSYTAVRQG